MSSESKHVVKFRDTHLKDSEYIITWAEGYIGEMMGKGDKTQYNGTLLVTNHRVVFYRKGMLGEVVKSFPLDKLTTIDRRSNMMLQVVHLHSPHHDLEFKSGDAQRVNEIVDTIEFRMSQLRPAPKAASTDSQEPIQALEKLTALLNAGYITRDEFEAKRQEILSRL